MRVCDSCSYPVDRHSPDCPDPTPIIGTIAKLDDTLVMITSDPDEDGNVGVMWLNPNRIVPLTSLDRRPL